MFPFRRNPAYFCSEHVKAGDDVIAKSTRAFDIFVENTRGIFCRVVD